MFPARSTDRPWEDAADSSVAPVNPVLAEYEARRCHVCRRKYPAFGIGYPATKKGETIWACGTHRHEVERMLTDNATAQNVSRQPKLF